MKFLLIASLVILQVWTATAAPKPKASATPAPSASPLPSFEEIISQAQDNFKSVSNHLNEMLGLPKDADAAQVFEVVKKNTENWTKDLGEVAEKIKKQVDAAKTGEVSDTVKSIQEKIQKTVDNLKKEIDSPEVKSKTKQLQESFTKSLNTIVEEAGKLSKTVSADKTITEDFQKLSKQVVDQAVKAAEDLQKSVHEVSGHGHHKGDGHNH